MASTNDSEPRNYYAEAYDRLMPNRSKKTAGIVPQSGGDVYGLAMLDMPRAVCCNFPQQPEATQ